MRGTPLEATLPCAASGWPLDRLNRIKVHPIPAQPVAERKIRAMYLHEVCSTHIVPIEASADTPHLELVLIGPLCGVNVLNRSGISLTHLIGVTRAQPNGGALATGELHALFAHVCEVARCSSHRSFEINPTAEVDRGRSSGALMVKYQLCGWILTLR